MTTIGHLFDESAGWEQRVAVTQLLERLPPDRFPQVLAVTSPAARSALRGLDRPIETFSRLASVAALAGPNLARFAAHRGIDVLHAWGAAAATVARTLSDTPLVVHLFDPCSAARSVKLLRVMAASRGFAAACSCEIVRRRLVEGGVPFEATVVIRPGVDFAAISRFRRSGLRERLGLSRAHRVIILPDVAEGSGSRLEAFMAVALQHALTPDLRVIVPGDGLEQRRIARFAATVPQPGALVATHDRYPFEQLVAAADLLLITPRGDASTTSIAWAMGAGVGVIGTAVYAVAELIASRVNGLLFKQTPGRSMTLPIVRLLEDHEAHAKVTEAARGQSYEVFSVRRFIEQHARLYENVLAGVKPSEGITDPAMRA